MITDIQFEALAKLCKLHNGSAMSKGARDVLVDGVTPAQAARNHKSNRADITDTVDAILRAIPLVHQAVTGEKR